MEEELVKYMTEIEVVDKNMAKKEAVGVKEK